MSVHLSKMSARGALFSVMADEGWSESTAIDVLCEYIDHQSSPEAFADHLEEFRAESEDF